MTFIVMFIKFIDFSIGDNIADKRKEFYLCKSVSSAFFLDTPLFTTKSTRISFFCLRVHFLRVSMF